MSQYTNVRIVRVGNMIAVHERGSSRMYVAEQWEEYCSMIRDFNTTGVREIKNYEDLPARTPLHANTPKASLDDLI